MASIADIKNLILNDRFSKIKELASKPRETSLKQDFQKTKTSDPIKGLFDSYFAQIEEKIITLVENILQQKLQEFENIVLERAKPGTKGDKPIAGVDFILPGHGKDADEKLIISKVISLLPTPPKIDKKEIINEVFGKVFAKLPKQKSLTLDEIKKNLQLDAEAIIGLSSFVKKYVPSKYQSGGGGGGDTIRYVDLSSSLDGATKVFTLTRVNRVLGVFGSSFPGGGFRPTTDWTFDTATSKLTFTSQIDETTTLASGQTIWVMYVES